MTRGRLLRVLILLVLGASTAALFVRVLLTAAQSTNACGSIPPLHGAIPGSVLAGAAAASFFLGGLFSAWRSTAAKEAPPAAGELAIHAVLVVLLAALAVALGYETFALAHPPTWPITFYIRCANVVAPGWTILGLAATCGLLGHWLWRPGTR